MTRRPRCVLCGSRQWHKESRGLIVCSEGHVLQNHRNESRELDKSDAHVLHKRAIKSTRKKKDKPSKADPRLYYGARGRFLYFQCQQLLLRKQIVALITLWNLPPEFEIVCRDIWALHLSLLPDPPPPEPFFHLQEAKAGRSRAGKIGCPSEELDADGLNSSSDDEETEGGTIDRELASLLRLNSESESDSSLYSSSVGSQAQWTGRAVRGVRRRGHKAWANDGPAIAIAVLVVACWTLRLPRFYMDFVRAIETHELPYLDPLRLLPQELTLHLTAQELSPPHPPNILTLHALSSRLARKMYERYGVWTPEVNGAPMLWRVIKSLGGTPTLYVLTKALTTMLSLTLVLDPALAAPLSRARKTDPIRHKFDNVPAEVALSCAAVVVLKMMYGLDGKARRPKDADDPSCVFPRLEDYIAYLREVDAGEGNSRAVVDSKSRQTAENWSDEMIDEYLTFCERALVDRAAEDGDSLLARYFPLSESQDGTRARREVREVRKELGGTGVVEGEEGERRPRPGEDYTIYSSKDVLGDVSEELEAVVGRVGRVCGADAAYVMKVVEMFERRLQNWRC